MNNIDFQAVGFVLYIIAFAWAIAINFRAAYAFIPLTIGFVLYLFA